MGPYGSQNFKYATPPTNHTQKFLKLPWLFFQTVITKLGLGFLKFWNFENWNFILFFYLFLFIFFVFVNMGLNGSKWISKRYSSYKSQPKAFKLVLTFPPNGPHKTRFWIFEILRLRLFNDFFFRNFQIHHCTLWRNQKPQLVSGKRAIVEQNGVKFGTQ